MVMIHQKVKGKENPLTSWPGNERVKGKAWDHTNTLTVLFPMTKRPPILPTS